MSMIKNINHKIPETEREFNTFILIEKDKCINYLRKYPGLSLDDSKDVFQEASIALYNNICRRKITTENLKCSLSTYLCRICYNLALKVVRDKNYKSISLDPDNKFQNPLDKPEYAVDENKLDELLAIVSDKIDSIEETIKNLPEPCKRIFRGYYWDDITCEQIAIKYDFANANTVKSTKTRCIKKFKEWFEQHFPNVLKTIRRTK